MARPIVALDLDGVVVKWFILLYKVVQERFGPIEIAYRSLCDPNFCIAFPELTREQIMAAVVEADQRFPVEKLDFKPGAREALSELRMSCDLVVITSRGDKLREETINWVERNLWGAPVFWAHAPGYEEFGSPGRKRKEELAREAGAFYLVEDNPHELVDWPDNSPVEPICCARPWNRSLNVTRPDIVRLDWSGIVEYLLCSRR